MVEVKIFPLHAQKTKQSTFLCQQRSESYRIVECRVLLVGQEFSLINMALS
jgi:hypothetical protein